MSTNSHLVFVYGTLKRGFSNHRVLCSDLRSGSTNKGYTFIGSFTTESNFEMYDLGAFPALVPSTLGDRILGELYKVDDNTLEQLDHLEGYPHFYDRAKFKISNGSEAWVYFLKNKDVQGCGRVTCIDTPNWYVTWES